MVYCVCLVLFCFFCYVFLFFSLEASCCVRCTVFVLVLSCAVLLCLYSSVCCLVVELRCVLYLSLHSFVLWRVLLCCAVLHCVGWCVSFVLFCAFLCSVLMYWIYWLNVTYYCFKLFCCIVLFCACVVVDLLGNSWMERWLYCIELYCITDINWLIKW